jgi:hypothetical protein
LPEVRDATPAGEAKEDEMTAEPLGPVSRTWKIVVAARGARRSRLSAARRG